ncbi:MAG: cysteine desulfurase family protein [Parasphingopyxis sp.]|uniref:cysteine desulfurase family protein n=1 Tax=Parasphingopyxis sp. TaxID=1920299 RepID=UPI003FA13F0F
MKDRLYLDHAATMPMLPEARDAVAEGFANWANPSSPHGEGRGARAALEEARKRIGTALDWGGEIVFTSGASEAIALAISCTKAERVIVSAVEHDAVLRAAGDVERIPVDTEGHVDGGKLNWMLSGADETALVAIQAVNSETGVRQDLDDLKQRVHVGGNWLFADCSQSAGKLPLPDADLIAISAHKLGGPPGIGALLVQDFATLHALGGQERGYRPGTENLPAALGFAAALEAPTGWVSRAAELREHLDKAIEQEGGVVVARDADRIPTIASYRMPGVAANAQLIQFDMAGIAVSAGSACSSGSLKPSHVLTAMGWSEADAAEVIRVSFGPQTNRADIYRFMDVWKRLAAEEKGRAA